MKVINGYKQKDRMYNLVQHLYHNMHDILSKRDEEKIENKYIIEKKFAHRQQ